jgi:hypothetical protein
MTVMLCWMLQLREAISFKAKGIDGDYKACSGITGGASCDLPGKSSGRGGA